LQQKPLNPGKPLTIAETLPQTKLTNRGRIIDQMLSRYQDARETCFGRLTAGMGEGGWNRMPDVWNPSYRKLEKLLPLYRTFTSKKAADELERVGHVTIDYWHLAEFYFRSQRVLRPKLVRGKGNRWVTSFVEGKLQYELQRCDNPRIVDRLVLAGVEWLDQAWPLWVLDSTQLLDEWRYADQLRPASRGERVGEPYLPVEFTREFVPGDEVLKGAAA
jgi:hypothetical protein